VIPTHPLHTPPLPRTTPRTPHGWFAMTSWWTVPLVFDVDVDQFQLIAVTSNGGVDV